MKDKSRKLSWEFFKVLTERKIKFEQKRIGRQKLELWSLELEVLDGGRIVRSNLKCSEFRNSVLNGGG